MGLAVIKKALAEGLRPPDMLDLAEWSQQNIILSPEDSAARGRYVAWEFQIEPMECMSPRHPADQVGLMFASQTGKSRLMLNQLAYVIAVDPGPTMYVCPRQKDAETISKDRVTPMLRDTPALRGRVADAKSRDAGNTIEHKKFIGGHLSFGIATSVSSLAMRPIRYLLIDEVSRPEYRGSAEGDPVRLAERRTTTFPNRKIVYASSPATEGECRISEIFAYSDQRQWFVPCPFCQHEQRLEWPGIVWSTDGKPVEYTDSAGQKCGRIIPTDEPMYRCERCDNLIPERAKAGMNAKGRYIPQNPAGRFPGFRVNQLVSPVVRWGNLVQEWLESKGKPDQRRAFVNTVLAETWKERGEAPAWEVIYSRREQYKLGTVPRGALFLTAGIDVQKDWIEIHVWGWGRNRECWMVDYEQLQGRTSNEGVWQLLSAYVSRAWKHEGGTDMYLIRFAIDTGYETSMVYEWARRQGDRVMPIKGSTSASSKDVYVGQPGAVDIAQSGTRIRRGVNVWPVFVNNLKEDLYTRLREPRPESGKFPSGWVHTPELPEEFYRQLTAEEKVVWTVKGYVKSEWRKTRPRNEALDAWVYARAATFPIGLDRITDEEWLLLEENLNIDKPAPAAQDAGAVMPLLPQPKVAPAPQQRPGGGWLQGKNRGWGTGNRW